MTKRHQRRQFFTQTQGFSLVEMIVVVGIVGLLLALGTTGINRIDKGQSLDVGKALVATMLEEVRLRSSVSTDRYALVVHNDPNSTGRYENRPMRYLAVAKFGTPDGGGAEVWQLEARGELLPKRIYLDTTQMTTANINLPGEGSTNCAVIGFEEGRFAGAVADSVIVLADTRRLLRSLPVFTEGAARIKRSSGLKVWANGRQSEFRNVDQIKNHEISVGL